MDIRDVLARRADLSTFLVHLTRSRPAIGARAALESIITQGRLNATTAYGQAVAKLREVERPEDSQRCVCFTETPLEHVYWLVQPIDGRGIQFAPYGVVIPKKEGRRLGANPVWYVDITPGRHWLTNYVSTMIESALEAGDFDDSEISKLTPFFEQMGTGENYRKEFWWEREWRHVGDLTLPPRVIVLCPQAEMPAFRALLDAHHFEAATLLDPTWGLEQIIARLAGYTPADTDLL